MRKCVVCRRVAAKPKPHLLGQLPADRLNPGQVLDCIGNDYAGPIFIQGWFTSQAYSDESVYVDVFVCFSVKAVHLELSSELKTAAFIATLRRFFARRGKPTITWSDHRTNFRGAAKEKSLLSEEAISEFCTNQSIGCFFFTSEHAPHFGGPWEAAIKSFKHHFQRVIGETRLTFEDFATILTQIEACLNSRSLIPPPEASNGLDV